MSDWLIFRGTGHPHDGIRRLPEPPSWRVFDGGPPRTPVGHSHWKPGDIERARSYQTSPDVVQLVNAAIYLRRPLLVTGKPGVGKSTLALAIAYELGLGPVLRWPITSRSTLQEGLYKYDAINRLHDVNLKSAAKANIGHYITLGPLGTALLPFVRPRVLLIDEIDKSDLDLPNDLLTVFEEGEYEIPELVRAAQDQPTVKVTTADGASSGPITRGQVRCHAFPIVILTSNREREFPPAFLRRCIPLEISPPSYQRLAGIVQARLGPDMTATADELIDRFLERQKTGDVATDQLLNAIYLTFHAAGSDDRARSNLADLLLQHLGPTSTEPT